MLNPIENPVTIIDTRFSIRDPKELKVGDKIVLLWHPDNLVFLHNKEYTLLRAEYTGCNLSFCNYACGSNAVVLDVRDNEGNRRSLCHSIIKGITTKKEIVAIIDHFTGDRRRNVCHIKDFIFEGDVVVELVPGKIFLRR